MRSMTQKNASFGKIWSKTSTVKICYIVTATAATLNGEPYFQVIMHDFLHFVVTKLFKK